MNHEERMARADVNGSSEFYFSYVLQFDDGTFYVGHTNAPAARWTEHAAGQSVATADKGKFRVRMAMPFGTRKEAQYNEERMQAALKSGADRLVALIQVFDQLINVGAPTKDVFGVAERGAGIRVGNAEGFSPLLCPDLQSWTATRDCLRVQRLIVLLYPGLRRVTKDGPRRRFHRQHLWPQGVPSMPGPRAR